MTEQIKGYRKTLQAQIDKIKIGEKKIIALSNQVKKLEEKIENLEYELVIANKS